MWVYHCLTVFDAFTMYKVAEFVPGTKIILLHFETYHDDLKVNEVFNKFEDSYHCVFKIFTTNQVHKSNCLSYPM